MKLNLALVLSVAATTVLAGDNFFVTNTLDLDGKWKAIGAWSRGLGAERPVKAGDECTYAPYTPWSEVKEICFDWNQGRGHFYLSNNDNKYCFRKYDNERVVFPGRTWVSQWGNTDCSW